MEYKKQTTKELIEKILSKGVRDMPTNPGALGYTEEQIKAFYYIPEKNILILLSNIEDEIIRYIDESSLEVNEILSLSINHENLKLGYTKSIPLTSFNRKPKIGDSFLGICKTDDDYSYAFVATITSVDNENNFANVEFTKVLLLFDPNVKEVNKISAKIIFEGTGNKFLADDGEYKEIVSSSENYTKGLSFTITSQEEKTCEVSNGTANSEEIIIPPYVFINGIQYTVTSVRNTGFFQKSNIKTVVIPETVTKIGNQAFDGCTNLVNIKIPSSVTELGSFAFRNCDSLEEIEIPDSVTTISLSSDYPRSIVQACNNLKKIVLGKGITKLPYKCFHGCTNLTDIIIKGKMTLIYTNAFVGVENATIWVDESLVDYYKNLLNRYISLPVKPFRDLIGLNKYINENSILL